MEYGIPKSVGFPLKDANTYEEWLDSVEKNLTANDIQSQYLVFRKSDDMLIGLLSIRHSLNRPDLKKYAGNIGYSVRPSERRKGYATNILKIGIDVCRELGIENALLICGEDNVASTRVIKKNGGVLHERVPLDDGVIQLRFYINTRKCN